MKYNDKVRVKSGFYEGMEGTVIKYKRSESFSKLDCYICILQSGLDHIESDWINESDLELIK